MPLLGLERLVVAVPHVTGNGLIQGALLVMPLGPRHGRQAGLARFEQRGPGCIDGRPLFRSNHIGADALAADARLVGKGIAIEQSHQAMESIGLALVRCGRQEQQIRRCL